jgi:hypothetical protein
LSLHRRAAKRDTSEQAIVDTLKACGWSVVPHSSKGAPDLIIGKHGSLMLWVECKTGKRKLNPDQVKWHAAWNGSKPHVLRSVDDAIALNTTMSVRKGSTGRADD